MSGQIVSFDSRNKWQTELNFDEHLLNRLGLHYMKESLQME